MQVENPSARSKAQDTVTKCQELFDTKKYYEYGQKIKLFAHRKLQSKKVQEGLYILQIAAIKLLSVGEDKEGQQLVSEWLKSLQDHKQVFSIDLFNSYIELYTLKPTNDRASQLQKLVKTFKDKLEVSHKLLVNKLLTEEYVRKGQYSSAEKYVVYLEQTEGDAFLNKWAEKLQKDEAEFVRMRFGLLKILYEREEQGEHIIAQIRSQSPFRRFADLLIQTFKLNFRQGFQKIGTSYSYLITEPSIQKLYWALGFAILGVRNSNANSNLLSMFE